MNFLFCINNKYCDVIKPVIYSILEHNSGNHCFYFIYADVSDYNQQKIISYTESLGCLAVFRKFDKDIRCLPILDCLHVICYMMLIKYYIWMEI